MGQRALIGALASTFRKQKSPRPRARALNTTTFDTSTEKAGKGRVMASAICAREIARRIRTKCVLGSTAQKEYLWFA